MSESLVLGIDLAGPGNRAGTVGALFGVRRDELDLQQIKRDLGDEEIISLIDGDIPDDATLVVGLDAPLSYNPGGGDRPGDRSLRRRLIDLGLPAGTVMVPTMSRMVYLTLRGLAVARLLESMHPGCAVAEVHPAGALALRGAPVSGIRNLKKSASGRRELCRWLLTQGVAGLPDKDVDDHTVAAYSAALAAWDWSRGRWRWLHRAEPPSHPHDYVC